LIELTETFKNSFLSGNDNPLFPERQRQSPFLLYEKSRRDLGDDIGFAVKSTEPSNRHLPPVINLLP
jgi:hypothetical protein